VSNTENRGLYSAPITFPNAQISELIRDPDDLLAMEPEELAPLVLRDVIAQLRSDLGNAPHIVSERGKTMLTSEQSEAYKYLRLLPRQSRHPAITVSTFALFARGHYDTVVFEAFRAVEIAVRDASGLPQDMVGTHLMRRHSIKTGAHLGTSRK
jgi:hypothetical protein